MAENYVQREADNTLAILTGFAPVEKEGDLVGFLENEGTLYFTDEVTEEDDAPVLLKNNSFAKLYEPITKLFSLPTYTELDPTPFFAPFFMMFFGFCLGDGGYGLLIMLVAMLLKKKFQKFKPLLTLAQWLGFATVIFGVLSGTFFGVALVDIEALKSVRKYFLNMDNMMMLSLIVGGVQIIYGMCVKAINIARQKGFKYAISQVATVVLVLTAAAYLGLPMLKVNVAGFVSQMLLGLIILSAFIYFFYNSPGKNPLMNFGAGLWNFYNLLTGLLGDLLSYIRLFALGLTGGILGGVFNTLALDVYGDKFSILGFLGMLLILLFGHCLNFMLNLLGAVVHPIRLTFVEFYKNSGFEGGGRAYNPLKREKE
jgi:V/A-type H+-transporting ATPase subunit I